MGQTSADATDVKACRVDRQKRGDSCKRLHGTIEGAAHEYEAQRNADAHRVRCEPRSPNCPLNLYDSRSTKNLTATSERTWSCGGSTRAGVARSRAHGMSGFEYESVGHSDTPGQSGSAATR